MRTLKFVKNESLTHAMNFGEEPAFPKGPGSLFTESPYLGEGRLYKVWQNGPYVSKKNIIYDIFK